MNKPTPVRETVHAAGMLQGSEVIFATSSNQIVFLVMGILLFVGFVVAAIVTFLKVRFSIAWVVPLGVVLLVAALWFAIKQLRSPWKWNRHGSFSDPSYRLRIVGDGVATEAVLNDLLTDTFEPVVLRSVGGVALATALPAIQEGDNAENRLRDLKAWQFESLPSRSAETIALRFACIALVVVLHRGMFGTWSGISVPHVMGAVGLAVLVRAFARPEYVRIAPGLADVFRYGFLGVGKPRVERFDLRTATITIDLANSAARIHDPSRPEFPVLYLSLRSLLAKPRTTATALLSGARSIGETPPLPTDALVG